MYSGSVLKLELFDGGLIQLDDLLTELNVASLSVIEHKAIHHQIDEFIELLAGSLDLLVDDAVLVASEETHALRQVVVIGVGALHRSQAVNMHC